MGNRWGLAIPVCLHSWCLDMFRRGFSVLQRSSCGDGWWKLNAGGTKGRLMVVALM